jgi:hypothetical protein
MSNPIFEVTVTEPFPVITLSQLSPCFGGSSHLVTCQKVVVDHLPATNHPYLQKTLEREQHTGLGFRV